MRILHTADWHIGKKLYGRQRFQEHEKFLSWLLQTLTSQKINGLIVAGDIFDTANPSEQARKIYQEFLAKACKTCDWIVITGGNHDSPSVLDGTRELLRQLNIFVIGKKCDDPSDELIEITNSNGDIAAYIAAVPYLRDRDLRQSKAGESEQEKEVNLRNGIKNHYDNLASLISERRHDKKIPAIAVGHLYAAGCSAKNEGDGVRDLYVGGLGHVTAGTFSEVYDYVALGHIHIPQIVGKKEHIRYSGSPIPMGYGEAGQQKQMILLDFSQADLVAPYKLEIIPIPNFQALNRVKGDLESITTQIVKLMKGQSNAWLEVIYTGEEFQSDLKSEITALTEGSSLEVLKIENRTARQRTMQSSNTEETLDQLSINEVFERCLNDNEVAQDEHSTLVAAYKQITQEVEAEQKR